MLPFTVVLKSGLPVYEQVLYAAKKAALTGQLRAGDPFPSVRTLCQELRINPNAAHKVVTALIDEGLLEVRSGIGTVVAQAPAATREQRRQLLEADVERLVVEARTMGLEVDDVLHAVRAHWQRLGRTRR